ncbi:MAG: thioredoxin domain-containing protein [Acidobacteriota bacterium]
METAARARRLDVRISSTDHVRGSPLAKVTLIGYGDFSNPDCARAYRTVQEIEKRMGSRLRYVFRCFPEPLKFANAEESAEAAECAASQGKFWEMHDRMFETSPESNDFHVARCAEEAGLDVVRFGREMGQRVHLARVRAGREAGLRHGIVRTPALFINSLRHESSFGLTTLLPAVQAAAGGP